MVFNPAHPSRGYQLLWPPELFATELAAVTELLEDSDVRPALRCLFEEALRGPDPLEDLARVKPAYIGTPVAGWAKESNEPVRDFGRLIFENRDALVPRASRRYYLARQMPGPEPVPADGPETDWLSLQKAWSSVTENLVSNGYLDRLAGDRCSDGQGSDQQAANINRLIREHCGLAGGWPLDLVVGNYPTDQDVFFTFVEVFHDLVARPRIRGWHDFDEAYCWSREFDDHAGQAVYRWLVNDLLTRFGVEYQLAESGEDQGLLVHAPPDDRQDLVAAAVSHPGGDGDTVRHALSLFRSRGADREAKRSACIALHLVLEDRRTLLKSELLSKDEGALFQIANQFQIRHQGADQHNDYDEAFLNWIFWWYLATIELTNRLIARDETADD